jgi:hypothetical protein
MRKVLVVGLVVAVCCRSSYAQEKLQSSTSVTQQEQNKKAVIAAFEKCATVNEKTQFNNAVIKLAYVHLHAPSSHQIVQVCQKPHH